MILLIIICSLTISFDFNSTKFFSKETTRILLVYVFADTHLFSLSNLKYFIRFGLNQSSNMDCFIIVQKVNNTRLDQMNLPSLPSFAHYIEHENECFDLGTIGWFFRSNRIQTKNYEYFFLLNSSARGPYLVSFYPSNDWYKIFTDRLNDYVKLVGPTINCQTSPHVQSYFWATDRKGMELLLNDSKIFSCHQSQVDAIYHGEIPASRVIFMAGFTIDSLMKKYQRRDFRKDGLQDCSTNANPTSEKQVDGISLDPFEIVFVKFKYLTNDFLHLQSRISAYDKWIHFQ